MRDAAVCRVLHRFAAIMDLTGHLGAHCECPYHHGGNWPDVAYLPLTNFMGRGI